MTVDGREVWADYYRDPASFYRARRMRPGRGMRWLDDPIKGMHVALAEWAGERVPKLKGTKRRYRRWRLGGLLLLERPLTPSEEREVAELMAAVRRHSRKHNKERNRA